MFLNLVLPNLLEFYLRAFWLSNGPEEKERTKCNEHVGMQKGANFILSVTLLIGFNNVKLFLFCFREHWPEMFDVVVCMAGKPGFFQTPVFSSHSNCW